MNVDLLGIPALVNYDAAVDWPARLEREGSFLRRALAGAPSQRVIDLGSGTGEHARWLAAQGCTVVGIEGVRERWEVAKRLAVRNVEHLIGDFGAVEQMVRGQFGAAICLGNTLPVLLGVEALSRMLIGLRRRFLPGGVFVAQLLNYEALLRRQVRELPERRLSREDGELVFRCALDLRADGVVEVTESVLHREAGAEGEGRVVHRRHRYLQGWRCEELLILLDVARFRTVEVFGGFAGEPFDLAASEELLVIAT